MTTKEFKIYMEGYIDAQDEIIRHPLKFLTDPNPDKIRDLDDSDYIHYMRGLLIGLTKNISVDQVLLPHINHLLEIANSVETQIFKKIDSKNKYSPPYWYNKDTIPLNKINKPNPIDIKYHDMNNK